MPQPPPSSRSGETKPGSRLESVDRTDAAAMCRAYGKLETQYDQVLRSNNITIRDYIEQVAYLEKKNRVLGETVKKLQMDLSVAQRDCAAIRQLHTEAHVKHQQDLQSLKQANAELHRWCSEGKQEHTHEKRRYERMIATLEEKVRSLEHEAEQLKSAGNLPNKTNQPDAPKKPDTPAVVPETRAPAKSVEVRITRDEIKKEPIAADKSAPLVRKQRIDDDDDISYRSLFLPNGEFDHETAIRYGQEEMERERQHERELSEQAESASEYQVTADDITNAYRAVAAKVAASMSSQTSNESVSDDHEEHAQGDESELSETAIKTEDISDFAQTIPPLEVDFDYSSEGEVSVDQPSDDGTVINHAQKHGTSPPVSPDKKRARNEVLFNGKDFLRNFNREYNKRHGLPSDYMVDEESLIEQSDHEDEDNEVLTTDNSAAHDSQHGDDCVADGEHVLNGFRRCDNPDSDSELHLVSVEPLEDDATSDAGGVLAGDDQVEIDSEEELEAALQDPFLELSKAESEATELYYEELMSAADDESFGRPVAASSPPRRKNEDVTSIIESEDPIRQARVQELMRKNLVAFNVRKASYKIDSQAVDGDGGHDVGNDADVEAIREKAVKTDADVEAIREKAVKTDASENMYRVDDHGPHSPGAEEKIPKSATTLGSHQNESHQETEVNDSDVPSMLVPEQPIITSSEEDSDGTRRGSPSPHIIDSNFGIPVDDFFGSLGEDASTFVEPVLKAKPAPPTKAKAVTESETTGWVTPPSAGDKVVINGVMLAPKDHEPWENKNRPHNLHQIREVSLRNIPTDVKLSEVLENMRFGIIERIDYDKHKGTVSVFYVEPTAAKDCYTYLHKFGNWVKTSKPGSLYVDGQTMLDLAPFLWSNQSMPVSPDMVFAIKNGEVSRVLFVTGLPTEYVADDVKNHMRSVLPPYTDFDKLVESVKKIRSHAEIRFTSIEECLRVKHALKALPEYQHGTMVFGPDTCGGLQGQTLLLTKKFMKFRGGPTGIRYSNSESPNTSGSSNLIEITREPGETQIKAKSKTDSAAKEKTPSAALKVPKTRDTLKFTDADGMQQAAALKQAAALDEKSKESSQMESTSSAIPKIPTAPKAMINAQNAARLNAESAPVNEVVSPQGSRIVSFATKAVTHTIGIVKPPVKVAAWVPLNAEVQTHSRPSAKPGFSDPDHAPEKSQGPAKLRPSLPTFKRPATPAAKKTGLPGSKQTTQMAAGVQPVRASFASVVARGIPSSHVQGTGGSFEERRGPGHTKVAPADGPYTGSQTEGPPPAPGAPPKVAKKPQVVQASHAEKPLPGPASMKPADKPPAPKHWATDELDAIAAYRLAVTKGIDEIKLPEVRNLDFKAPDQYTETFHPRAVRLTNVPPDWGYDDLAPYIRGGAVDTMTFVTLTPPHTPPRAGPPPGKAAVIIFVLQLAAEKFRAFIVNERVTPRPGYTLNADSNLGLVPGVCVYTPEKVVRLNLSRCLAIQGLPHGCTAEALRAAINQLAAGGEIKFESIKVTGVCARVACASINQAVFIYRNINRAKGYLGVRVQYTPDPCNGELWEMGRKNV